ncbi:ribonuclease H-like domain-containing protein [Tanacetum coccineum]
MCLCFALPKSIGDAFMVSMATYGTLSRYKARLMANGSTQLEGVDVDETFSSVVKPGTIRTVHSLAASRHWPIHQLSRIYFYIQGMDTAYFLLYVNDIVLTASSQALLLASIVSSLHAGWMFLSQKKYDVDCNSSRTLVDTESKLGIDGDPVYDSSLYRSLSGVRLFMKISGALFFGSLADFAGYCVFLENNLLFWSSKRQPTLSRSTAEVEYRDVVNVVVETCWLRNLLRELHTLLSFATLVYCDNVSVVYLSSNPVQHQCMKHIGIDIHFVRDLVAADEVRVLHVPSRYQYADIFTKCLPSALFEDFPHQFERSLSSRSNCRG